MASSDSDIEVLDEVPKAYGANAKAKRNSRRPLYVFSDDEDALLDIDEMVDVNSGFSGSYKSKTTRTEKTSKPAAKKIKTPSVVDLADGHESDVTEIMDDLESLPSISNSPPPAVADSNGRENSHYDNYVVDVDEDDVKRGTSSADKPGSSKNSTYEDRESQEIDDFFQDAGYSSLADYLADVEKCKKAAASAKTNFISASCSIPFLTSVAVTTSSKSQPKKGVPKQNSTRGLHNTESTSSDKEVYNQVKLLKEKEKSEKKGKSPKKVETEELPKSVPVKKPKAGDGFKMIVLQVAEEIMSDQIAAKLLEKEIQFKIIEQPELASSIYFERNQHIKMIGWNQQVQEKVVTQMEPFFMVVFNVEKGLKLLQSEDRKSEGLQITEQCLTDWIKRIQRNNSDKQLTLLIGGLEAYLKKINRRVQKEFRDRVNQGDNATNTNNNAKRKRKVDPSKAPIELSRYEIQSAIIRAQLETRVNYRFYENATDFCNLLLQYTKSIGDAPFKVEKMNSMEFDWYAVSDCVGGVPVDDDGKGSRSLWLSQLSQFPGVGQESAIAIARVYGSPIELYQAYRRCSCADEGKSMLTNIQVTMGVGPLAKTRKLGPEASKKIYRFFTATDGERYVST